MKKKLSHFYFLALGFQQFLSQDSDVTLEIVEEGKEHIKREKRRRQRLLESQTRRRDFATRFGDADERGTKREKIIFESLLPTCEVCSNF